MTDTFYGSILRRRCVDLPSLFAKKKKKKKKTPQKLHWRRFLVI